MKKATNELKKEKIVKESKKSVNNRRYHPLLNGFYTDDEAKEELKKRN